eukprot:gene39462-53352_t
MPEITDPKPTLLVAAAALIDADGRVLICWVALWPLWLLSAHAAPLE